MLKFTYILDLPSESTEDLTTTFLYPRSIKLKDHKVHPVAMALLAPALPPGLWAMSSLR